MRFGSRALGRTLALAIGLVSLAIPIPARADAESDAKDLFVRGRELRTKGDCASASPLFYKAWKIYPRGLGNLRNHAECEEQVGHFASARRAWLDLKRTLVTQSNDPKYEGWDKDADEAAARLKPKVAVLTIEVTVRTRDADQPANEKSGVELSINGETLAANLNGTPLERDPGEYRIRVQAPDAQQPAEAKVVLAAGETNRVALVITLKPDEVRDSRPAPHPLEADHDPTMTRTLGWVSVGVGAASLVGAGVTFLLYTGAKSDLESACGPDFENTCPLSKEGQRNDAVVRGKLMGTLSPILLGVGLVGIGAGVALVLTSSSKSSTARSITVYPGVGRVDATWRF